MNPANRGAGIPDIGLFTADQFQKAADLAQRQGQLPSRGVLEAKPLSQNVNEIAASEQVKKYCAKYGLVIVTNLREFLLERELPAGTQEYIPLAPLRSDAS